MHVPHYHKKRSWQIFLLGIFIGSVVAYILLAFMYGKMYEKVLTENIQLHTKVIDLERQNEALLHQQEQEEERKHFTIHSIEIQFANSKDLRLDRLILHQLEELLKTEIGSIIVGKEITSISENDDLLVTVIENKVFTIDELSYQFEVKKLSISERVKLTLHVKLAD